MSALSRLALSVITLVAMSGSVSAATEIVNVAKLGDMYEIVVITVQQSLIPFHPDKGFFPKLRREVRFVTTSLGEPATIAGHEYQRFIINRGIVTVPDNCLYSEGEVLFSEKSGELIIKGTLSQSHSKYTNHSGHYKGVHVSYPAVATLDKDVDLSKFPDTYVTAKGVFESDRRHFVSDGATYEVLDLCSPKDGTPVEIIAHVIVPIAGSRNPYLFVLRKNGGTPGKCCPWGT